MPGIAVWSWSSSDTDARYRDGLAAWRAAEAYAGKQRPAVIVQDDRFDAIASQLASSQTLRGVSFEDLQDYRRPWRVRESSTASYSVFDPLTLVSVMPALGGVTLIACAIPA